MGYRSDVRIMTTPEGFRQMCERAWVLAEERGWQDYCVLLPKPETAYENSFAFFDVSESYICFGYDWIKWYEDYRDVLLVKEALEYVGDAGIPWQFMRDGEDYDDVESDETDNFFEFGLPVLCIHSEITY